MIVFVDTNVLLDVLAHRTPFYNVAMPIWTLAETGRIEGYVAAISFTNCYYMIRKFANRTRAEEAVRALRDTFTTVDLTAQVLNQAIDAGFDDFEDAIHFHSAIQAQAECIITRNPDDFPKFPLSILSPADFLVTHSFE